jgi:hypothetical protein
MTKFVMNSKFLFLLAFFSLFDDISNRIMVRTPEKLSSQFPSKK